MKLSMYVFLVVSCATNWLVAAYQPLLNLMKSKKTTASSSTGTGLFKTISGIFARVNPLNMEVRYSDPRQERSIFSFFFLSNLFPSRQNENLKSKNYQYLMPQSQSIDRDIRNTVELKKLEEKTPAEEKLMKKLHSYQHVAGFMEYDPKFAARSAYRITANKRGKSSWLNM